MKINGRKMRLTADSPAAFFTPKRLTAEAVPCSEGVTIRLDDEANQEFWMEIRIEKAELLRWLDSVETFSEEVRDDCRT